MNMRLKIFYLNYNIYLQFNEKNVEFYHGIGYVLTEKTMNNFGGTLGAMIKK